MAIPCIPFVQYLNNLRKNCHSDGIAIETVYPPKPEPWLIQKIFSLAFATLQGTVLRDPLETPLFEIGTITSKKAWFQHKLLTPPCLVTNGVAIVVCSAAMTTAALLATAKVAVYVVTLGFRIEHPTGFYRSGQWCLGSIVDIIRNIWEVGHDGFWLTLNTSKMLGFDGAVNRLLGAYVEVISPENAGNDLEGSGELTEEEIWNSRARCFPLFNEVNNFRFHCFQVNSPDTTPKPTFISSIGNWTAHKALALPCVIGNLVGVTLATGGMTIGCALVALKVAAFVVCENWKFTFSTGFVRSGRALIGHANDVVSIVGEVSYDAVRIIWSAGERLHITTLFKSTVRAVTTVGSYFFESLR